MTTYIGIDPGWSGGFALKKGKEIRLEKMPKTDLEIWNLLSPMKGRAVAWLEYVHAMGGNGSIANWKLGGNDAILRCVMKVLKIPFHEVKAKEWQAPLQPLPKGGGKERTKRKNVIKAKMIERYPDQHKGIILATADALAILDYGLSNRETK